MRITYTADDGTTWDSEAQCLGWERFCRLLADAEEDGEFADFGSELVYGWNSEGMKALFKERSQLFRLTDLMRKAMLLG